MPEDDVGCKVQWQGGLSLEAGKWADVLTLGGGGFDEFNMEPRGLFHLLSRRIWDEAYHTMASTRQSDAEIAIERGKTTIARFPLGRDREHAEPSGSLFDSRTKRGRGT